ncbi:peptidoglycan-binding protein [Streptomyces sp. NBC_01476]|uniref:peptidoglycan-binding protein n=1 Tax=Streptomyces sp. NBC_01476 TaxID=2903881 RepID=UPI002E373E49|nr:peptidoglycan-binding protein [Streptomyces sp. NBC_01476]
MSTGPQKYPGADTAHWYQNTFSSDAMETNVVVWHSTEGTTLPDYDGGSTAPNLTAVPDFKAQKLVWYQHFDIDRSSRALVNLTGGVETNTLNVVQVEIVGTCDPGIHKKWGSTAHLYMADLPAWVIRDLADFARWAHDNHGVPLTSGVSWKAYSASYGADNGVRMSSSHWESFRGHCGHQHVPENLHGDPGAFPMAAILAKAGANAVAVPAGSAGAVKPKVSLKNVVAAAKADPPVRQGKTSHPADVKPVEAALRKLGYLGAAYATDGAYGTTTVAAYAAYQRNLGYSGKDADGIPGATSLKKLAAASGLFTVTA